MDKKITDDVECGLNDGEFLPLLQCVCGMEFPNWEFLLRMDRENAKACPKCRRELFFKLTIDIYEKIEVEK